MIEVNLIPGARRRRRLAISLPKLGGLPTMDAWLGFVAVAWIVGLLAFGWMFLGSRWSVSRLEGEIRVAVADSANYAQLIQRTERMRARRDTIAEKLHIIQEIDAGRYVWAHILDEVSRALPEYTWLNAIRQTQGGPQPRFRIEGMTGNNFALTRFMDQLEASPFLLNVQLTSTQMASRDDRLVHAFVLQAGFQDPPPEAIETVPLFDPREEE